MLKYVEYINEAKKEVKYPFIQAATRGNNNKVKEFIKSGVDINMKDTDDKTALMYAVKSNLLFVVNTLIDAGADPNIQDREGRTALMMASTNKIFNKLLDAGADVNIKNINGDNFLVVKLDYFGNLDDQKIRFFEKLVSKGLNIKNENKFGRSFYDILVGRSEHSNQFNPGLRHLLDFKKYIDEKFPEIKEGWDLKNDMVKYNL